VESHAYLRKLGHVGSFIPQVTIALMSVFVSRGGNGNGVLSVYRCFGVDVIWKCSDLLSCDYDLIRNFLDRKFSGLIDM
jgi:hypothetical protein